ncbi:MAG: menaquinol oxidoreductase, partial [Deltaproteobacteria bacterium]|nr:menaquinol oxidoreductase [Deltaproteobacteria bacterium]
MFRRNFTLAIAAVIILSLIPIALVLLGLMVVLTVVLPYLAFVIFVFGFIYRVVKWAKAPVPFRIPTTCGQEKSLPWIKNNPLENPCCKASVIGRMASEIFLFRSLFRNSNVKMVDGRPVYG